MLIEKSKFKNGDVLSIKLVTGGEIVGMYIAETNSCIDLDKPYRLIQTEEQKFGFAPLMITTDPAHLHTIYKTAIAIITPTYKEINEQYVRTVEAIPQPAEQSPFEEVK
jgi:hypothetical protein